MPECTNSPFSEVPAVAELQRQLKDVYKLQWSDYFRVIIGSFLPILGGVLVFIYQFQGLCTPIVLMLLGGYNLGFTFYERTKKREEILMRHLHTLIAEASARGVRFDTEPSPI